MKSEVILREYEGLIRATTKRVVRNFNRSRHINDYEDFLSVARVAAWRAITTYRDDKNAKLSTYIVRCIQHKLFDLDRAANKKAAPDLEFIGDSAEIEYRCVTTERYLPPSSILNDDEANLLRKVIKGKDMPTIVRERSFSKHITRRKASLEVSKCLRHIRQRLTLKELSQLILT